jgi:hypothetical protein
VQPLVVHHDYQLVAERFAQHERARQLQCVTCAQTMPGQKEASALASK